MKKFKPQPIHLSQGAACSSERGRLSTFLRLRGHLPRVGWALLALAASPLAAALLVSFTETIWSSAANAIVVAVGLAFSAALLWLARIRRAVVATFLGLQLLLAAPLDMATGAVRGGPRVLALVMGLLSAEGLAAAERGEFIAGGCIVSGLEPQWVIAW